MKRFAAVIAVLLLACAVALPAAAQAKDPFQPAPGVGEEPPPRAGSGAPAGPAVGGAPPARPPGDGLPRTGLDYSLPLLTALGLIAAGASLRLAASASAR